MPRGQTHNDNFLGGTIHSKRNEALVAQVTVCYLAPVDQLHRTIIRPGVVLVKGGFLRVLSRNESKVAVRNRKGQANGLLAKTSEVERMGWLQDHEQSKRVSDGKREINISIRCEWERPVSSASSSVSPWTVSLLYDSTFPLTLLTV